MNNLLATQLDAVQWFDFPSHGDERGLLTAVEGTKDIPIDVKRIFYMHRVESDRGGHAHIDTDQVLIAIAGQFKVTLCDGVQKRDFVFDDPTRGLFVPRMTFTDLHDFSDGAVCLVLANTHYDMRRSLRSWDAYTKAVAAANQEYDHVSCRATLNQ